MPDIKCFRTDGTSNEVPKEKTPLPFSSTTKNFRNHVCKIFAIFYVFIIICFSGSTAIRENAIKCRTIDHVFYTLLYSSQFILSICTIIGMMVYFFKKRSHSFENVIKGDTSTHRFAFSLHGEHVNLYLRGGIVLFGIMSIIFQVARVFECHDVDGFSAGNIIMALLTIGFFIAEIVFILVLHRLVILSHPNLFGFMLLQLMTANLCVWLDASLEKVNSSVHKYQMLPTYFKWIETTITPYLLPAVSEFCAIMAAVFYELLKRVGKLNRIEIYPEQKDKDNQVDKTEPCQLSKYRKMRIMHVAGFICCALVLIVVFLLELHVIETDINRYYGHLAECSILVLIALGLSFATIKGTKHLKFTANVIMEGVDEQLLYVTYFANVLYDAILIIALTAEVGSITSKDEQILCFFRIAYALLDFIEVTVQTYVIQDSFYRCAEWSTEGGKKWGQTLLGSLLAINMSLWMILSFQVKNQDVMVKKVHHELHMVFMYTVFPMVVLYRFHATVCLSVSFHGIFEDEVTRFASMLTTMDFPPCSCLFQQVNGSQIRSRKISGDENGTHVGLRRTTSLIIRPTYIVNESSNIPLSHTPPHYECKRRRGVADTGLSDREIRRMRALRFTGRRPTWQNLELAKMRVERQSLAVQLAEKQLTTFN